MAKRAVLVTMLVVGLAGVMPPGQAAGGAADGASGPSGPVVYAHRGGALEGPENTLGAFRQTISRYGPDVWLELDTQLAADGVLVVIHDHTLDRTTDCDGPVKARTSVELSECNAAAGWNASHPDDQRRFEPVPTLASVLTHPALASARFMVELKNIPGEGNFDPTGEAAAVALVRLVVRTGVDPSRILVQSFFPTSLDQVELRAPGIRTALLTTSQLPGAPPGAGFLLTENALYSTARGYEVSAPDHATPDMGAGAVAGAHALGRDVVVWTVDTPERALELVGFGVDGIITNAPGALLEALSPS